MSTLYFKVTDACNMRCPFCYVDQKVGPSDFSLEPLISILDEHPEIHTVILHGGEPLLYPERCLDVIKLCRKRNLQVSITSNMTLQLTEERERVLREVDGIATSYSIDRFAGQEDSFAAFLDNTQWLNDQGLSFTLLVTMSEPQLRQPVKDLLAIISQIKPRNITFERLYITNRIDKLYERTDAYLLELFQHIPPEQNNLYQWMIDSCRFNIPVFDVRCSSLTANQNGHLYQCPNMNGAHIKKARRRECLECKYYRWCQGDCPSFRDTCSFPKQTFQYVMNTLKMEGGL